jgi:hypothetical protein
MEIIKQFSSYAEIEGKYSIPSIQRDIIDQRVSELRTHIKDNISKERSLAFGCISIVNYNQKYYIIDGQHRLKAIREEYKLNNLIISFNAIIYDAKTKEDMQYYFTSINKGIPIPQFLIDCDNEAERDILKEIQKYISTKKGFELKKSSRPYTNIDHFMDVLRKSDIMKNIANIDDFKIIYEFVNSKNRELILNPSYVKKQKISSNMLMKWKEFHNYMGVDLHLPWFDNSENCQILKSLIVKEEIKIEEIKVEDNEEEIKIEIHEEEIKNESSEDEKLKTKNEKNGRIKFTASQRQQVWHQYIGIEKGRILCPYCQINPIEPLNYVIAHVIPLTNGGSNDMENLRPLCNKCNSSIYTNNIDLSKYKI